MNSVLNGKIALLGLIPIDKKAYKKSGSDISRFKYYRLHGQKTMFYSVEYLMLTSIKNLLERDKGNKERLGKADELLLGE